MAGGMAAFVLLGWWIDRQFRTDPIWTVVGAVLGGVGGMVHLIRRALLLQREDQAERQKRLDDGRATGDPIAGNSDDAAPRV